MSTRMPYGGPDAHEACRAELEQLRDLVSKQQREIEELRRMNDRLLRALSHS